MSRICLSRWVTPSEDFHLQGVLSLLALASMGILSLNHILLDTTFCLAMQPQSIFITTNISSSWYEALEDTPDDQAAVDRMLAFNIRWFLDPIVFGDYPGEMREKLGSRLPKFSPEESGKLAGSFDFMGINHYITVYATSNPHLSPHLLPQRYPDSMVYLTGERNGIPIGEQTAMEGSYVVPRGIQNFVQYLTEIYNRPPIIITENESKNASSNLPEALEDARRINFHSDYLKCLAKAIRIGSDVRGYFIWSLLDNFEWTHGFTIQFGLYHVDSLCQHRYPKLSAHWIKQFLHKNTSDTENTTIYPQLDNAATRRII